MAGFTGLHIADRRGRTSSVPIQELDAVLAGNHGDVRHLTMYVYGWNVAYMRIDESGVRTYKTLTDAAADHVLRHFAAVERRATKKDPELAAAINCCSGVSKAVELMLNADV